MLKVFIDGKHLQDQLRQCKIKRGQEFHLKFTKLNHEHQGQWDVYFESLLPEQEIQREEHPGCSVCGLTTHDKSWHDPEARRKRLSKA